MFRAKIHLSTWNFTQSHKISRFGTEKCSTMEFNKFYYGAQKVAKKWIKNIYHTIKCDHNWDAALYDYHILQHTANIVNFCSGTSCFSCALGGLV